MTAAPIMMKVRAAYDPYDQREMDLALSNNIEEAEEKSKQTPMVSWSECLPLIERIEQRTGWGHAQILREAGYAAESSFEKWTKAGQAAKRFKMGLLGILFELKVEPQPSLPTLGYVEMAQLFAVVNGIEIPTEQRRRLSTKLAKEMASYGD